MPDIEKQKEIILAGIFALNPGIAPYNTLKIARLQFPDIFPTPTPTPKP